MRGCGGEHREDEGGRRGEKEWLHRPTVAVRAVGRQSAGLNCGQCDQSAYPCGRRRLSAREQARKSARGEGGQSGDGFVQYLVALAEREAHEGPGYQRQPKINQFSCRALISIQLPSTRAASTSSQKSDTGTPTTPHRAGS